MAKTKSGIETPTTPPKQSLAIPVKTYPGSSKIGSGSKGGGNCAKGPASK